MAFIGASNVGKSSLLSIAHHCSLYFIALISPSKGMQTPQPCVQPLTRNALTRTQKLAPAKAGVLSRDCQFVILVVGTVVDECIFSTCL